MAASRSCRGPAARPRCLAGRGRPESSRGSPAGTPGRVQSFASSGGSPPRARGAPAGGAARVHGVRIIPACAGRTKIAVKVTALNYGSPPRVRGALQRRVRRPDLGRITPACAGRSGHSRVPTGGTADHPRVCGEETSTEAGRTARDGSPPRVRGGGRGSQDRQRLVRITPACAGRRSGYLAFTLARTDHPRVCLGSVTPGAKQPRASDHPRVCGEERAYRHGGPAATDHPRVCGEEVLRSSANAIIDGSPPRVRGGVDDRAERPAVHRITPACAGVAFGAGPLDVLPAHAGVIRSRRTRPRSRSRPPRTPGDPIMLDSTVPAHAGVIRPRRR